MQHIRYMPSGAVLGNTEPALQHRLFCGKELQPLHGWNVYDSRARMQYNVLPRFSSPDPLSEKYYHLSPYAYCANDPINMVDPEGRDVWLFATNLPNDYMASIEPLAMASTLMACAIIPNYSMVNILSTAISAISTALCEATHTFIVVINENTRMKVGSSIKDYNYFAFGPRESAFGSQLERCCYIQDLNVIEGNDPHSYKSSYLISPPEGMTSEEFDNAVVSFAKSFGNNENITYSLFPNGVLQGNCNTSSSTILNRMGANLKGISLPGISWGFSTDKSKPWTKEEQEEAVNLNTNKYRLGL